MDYVLPPNQTPPPDPPRGQRAVFQRLEEIDEQTRKDLEVPAFLRRQNVVDVAGAISAARRSSPLTSAPMSLPEQSFKAPYLSEVDTGKKALDTVLADLEHGGEPVLQRALARHGLGNEGRTDRRLDVEHAILQLDALITAFQEVAEYDPIRHHNQPPPALWVSSPEYVTDLAAVLSELRELNGFLRKTTKVDKPKEEVEKSASLAMVAGKKFIESYADVMGKGAAALTIGGIAGLFIALGVDKSAVEPIWNLLKPSK